MARIRLPSLLDRKIYKTGQTRGADDDEIYQNRVLRSSTVLIPYSVWIRCFTRAQAEATFAKGYIVLLPPGDYFGHLQSNDQLAREGLTLGYNALVFYESRDHWSANNPTNLNWQPAESRLSPLQGHYVARISATTSIAQGAKIVRGFETSTNKGAGIRVYEYANDATIDACRMQLEALFWLCEDSAQVAATNGMTPEHALERRTGVLNASRDAGLLDIAHLQSARILSTQARPVCPLCLEEISAAGFFSRMLQAEGREVLDLTITQINIFHIEELRMGVFNHRPYNHHCNVVVKDSGITDTLLWMKSVLDRNSNEGHMPTGNSDG